MRRVLFLGASGMTGAVLLREWSKQYPEDIILPLGRRLLPEWTRMSNVRPILMPFLDRVDEFADELDVDVVVSCWGTTRAKVKSAQEFVEIEKEYLLKILHRCFEKGARQLVLQSSVGSSPHSRNLYLRTKGEIEAELVAMDWEKLCIVRPSLLLGERKELRLGEGLARNLVWLYNWCLPVRYKAISVQRLAQVILSYFGSMTEKLAILEGSTLFHSK